MKTEKVTNSRDTLTFEICETLSSETSISDLQLVQTLHKENSNLELAMKEIIVQDRYVIFSIFK